MHLRFLFLILFFASCGPTKPTPEKRLQRMAASYCECAAGIAQTNQEMKDVPPTSPKFDGYLAKLQNEYERSAQCLSPVLNELGPITQNELSQLQDILKGQCPDLSQNKELLQELLCK